MFFLYLLFSSDFWYYRHPLLFTVVAQLSSDGARYRGNMRCTDSSSISDCNVIADNRSWLRRINHRCIGHGVDNRRSNVSSPAVVRIDIGEYVLRVL